MPKELNILGREYSMAIVDDLGYAGLCDYVGAALSVRSEQDKHETIDCTIHEVFHAILYQQGRLNGGKTEELYVRALATGLTAVLKQNPAFTAYIQTLNHKD